MGVGPYAWGYASPEEPGDEYDKPEKGRLWKPGYGAAKGLHPGDKCRECDTLLGHYSGAMACPKCDFTFTGHRVPDPWPLQSVWAADFSTKHETPPTVAEVDDRLRVTSDPSERNKLLDKRNMLIQ